MMTTLICASAQERLPEPSEGVIPVLSCANFVRYNGAFVGRRVPEAVARLGPNLNEAALDLLAISMAVTAADTFIKRELNSDDGWCRVIRLVVEVQSPDVCGNIKSRLEEALSFLSGDMWTIDFEQGVPWDLPRTGAPIVEQGNDCVSLFSGGLDSAIGALDAFAQGRNPLLVSHAYQGDNDKQEKLHAFLPTNSERLNYIAYPRNPRGAAGDVSMRTRSFNFLAMAGVAASALAVSQGVNSIDLFVPENGFIALNPPLTNRRLGSHSTRTTHPYFLDLIQSIFDTSGIPARITNPYRHKTKGEMLRECRDQRTLGLIAEKTVSCGKWKRERMQCGRCLPCMIRRAAFLRAGMTDGTEYGEDHLPDALQIMDHRDDVLAVSLATNQPARSIAAWCGKSGPLPENPGEYQGWVDVVTRGVDELRTLLDAHGIRA